MKSFSPYLDDIGELVMLQYQQVSFSFQITGLRLPTQSNTREIRMNNQENQDDSFSESGSASKLVGCAPLSGPSFKRNSSQKSTRFKEDECCVEITVDVHDDSILVQNIKRRNSETESLTRKFEKKPSTLGSHLSFQLRQVSLGMKQMASSTRFNKVDRTKSGAARALKGLKFIGKKVGSEGWSQVEARFKELAVNEMLPKTRFAQCIGMH